MASSPAAGVREDERHLSQLLPAFAYILVAALVVWAPLILIFTDLNPIGLFTTLESFLATAMFFAGAILANSTAVGGGIVFNPMLQLVFRISGLSALSLAIIVQCAGMASGTYGWYKRGEFTFVDRGQLLAMAACACGSTTVFSLLLVSATTLIPTGLLLSTMKVASALVSFYVALLLWNEIKLRRAKPTEGMEGFQEQAERSARLKVDWRIYPWISFGSLLNVTTAVGIGELTFSHIMKYYRAPAKQSVAIGVMMQALSVICQSAIILVYMVDYVIVPMVCIGLLVTMAGGRLAPYLMTRRIIEPYVKHALALTAFGMGMTSLIMLLLS